MLRSILLDDYPILDKDGVVIKLNVNNPRVWRPEDLDIWLDKAIWLIRRGFDDRHRLYSLVNPITAASLVKSGQSWRCSIFVGRRKYDFPHSIAYHINKLASHIHYCIDIEASFFDTPSCVNWMS